MLIQIKVARKNKNLAMGSNRDNMAHGIDSDVGHVKPSGLKSHFLNNPCWP